MEQKETYWSRFADDFDERNYYVVGKSDIDRVADKLASVKNLKSTIELGCRKRDVFKNTDKKCEFFACN